ncbi:BRCA2, oligonucleotide/oligosaccharide-binding, domain 1-domain-containing protein [Cladochytrium replicatum]|nr:BRCA2, oligonucleotide/oligosaccharide-binding, domain 1-domain-containing protein [Cladochytrium replicatum]
MTSASADSYRFPIDINNGWGVPEAHSALLEAGVIPTVATEKWVQNHYRWIVWKCAGMIRSFPEEFRRFWSPQYVLNQIKYRYEREVNRVHRSAIKMIVERDDLPSKFLVLCVSEIHPQSNGSVELDLTDGWYKIRASIDKALQRAVDKEKIFVGMKLRIAQAQLHSPRDATDVLDVTTETKLILSANGTRRATWDAKLGYQPRSTFTVRIGGISSDGGVVPCIDVVVLRKYVMQVMERLPNKSYIFRSAREDDIVSKKWNSDRDRILQSLETEFYQKSPMQHEVDSDIARDAIDQLKAELAEKLEELHPPRDTRTLINVRVCDYPLTTDSTLVKHAIFTIWAPNDNVLSMINEGQRLKIHRVAPRSVDRIQSKALMTLQTIRGTRFQSLKSEEEIVRDVFQPRSFASCTDLNHSKRGDEVDLVAHILSVGWRNCFQRNQGLFHEQLICATDHTGLLIVVRVGSYVPNPIWRAGVTVALLNMEYSYYSETGGAHVLRATMNYDVFRPGDTGIAGEIASTISAWASSQANLDELINDATVALDSVGPTLGPIGECPDCAKSIIAPFPLKPTTNDDVEGANLQTKSGQTISDLGYILRAHNNGENVDVKSGEILLGWDNGIEMMHLRCPADLFRSALIRIAKRYPKIVDNVVLLGEGKGEVQSSAVAICIENSFRMTQLTEETELDSCLDALSFVLLQCQYCPANRRISSLELPSKCIMEGLI